MAIHKLSDGPITLQIKSVEEVEGNFGPQWKFEGTNGDLVFLSSSAAERQVTRLNLDSQSVVGQILHFSQTKKDGKTFNNIALAGAQPPAGATPAAPRAAAAPAAPAPKMTVAEAATLYDECVRAAMTTLGLRCEEASIPFDAAAIQSAAATIFIKVTR